MNETRSIVGQYAFANQNNYSSLGLFLVVILGIAILVLPRRLAPVPVLIMACFVSLAQRIVVVTLDFDFLRIIILFGFFRIFIRKEMVGFQWKLLDKVIVLYVISSCVFTILRLGPPSIVNRMGTSFNILGSYFLFRFLIRDWDDIVTIIKASVILAIILACFFMIEKTTRRNWFSIFGGVLEITAMRQDRLRCQGAFSHPILAGCFWSGMVSLFAALWWKSSIDRFWAVIGLFSATTIVICCASSTPVMGIIFAGIGGIFFMFRKCMKTVRWALLLTLVVLHIVMKAPVWYLISRINVVSGSTGWHRANLIEQAIRHFNQWWFYGCSGDTVASWGIWKGDVTNHYLFEGIQAGIVTLGLFVLLIGVAFRNVGQIWRNNTQNSFRLAFSWALGVGLLVHCMNFLSVAYFGQAFIVWYLLLAMIGSLAPAPRYSRVVIRSESRSGIPRFTSPILING